MTDTQKLDALDKLIAAVEAGDLGDVNRILGQMFAADHSLPWEWISNVNSAFKGSLDAALALHNALLPGWVVKELRQFEAGFWLASVCQPQNDDWPKWIAYPFTEALDGNPARAWLLAILKAYRTKVAG